jgi:type IX secretion system PorP/SprF family membrane protein
MKKWVVILFVSVSFISLKGQDVVFSQFANTTIMINPAITGNYLGVVRTTLNQRVQYTGFGMPYNTSMLTVDKSIKRKGRRRDRISYGAYAVNDRAYSTDRVELRQYSVSIGYHKLIEKKKYKHKFLSVGVQNGYATRIAFMDNFFFDRQITPHGYDESIDHGERFYRESFGYPTMNVGLLYTFADSSYKKPLVKFTLGYGMFNTIPVSESVTSSYTSTLHSRHHFNTSMVYWFVGNKAFIKADALFSLQGNSAQLKTRTILDYWYSRKYAFLAGVNMNAGRSIGPVLGLGFKNVNITYSMDIASEDKVGYYTAYELTLVYLNPMPGREKIYALRAGDAKI